MSTVVLTWRELGFPASFGVAEAMVFTRLLAMRPLHGLFRQPDPVVCEVVGTPGGLRWQLGATGREAGTLLPQLRSQLPGIAADPVENRGLPALRRGLELRLDSKVRCLRTDVAESATAALLTALRGVYDDEALVLSWVIGPWLARPAVQRGDRLGVFGTGLESEEATALRAKLAEPVLGTVGRIGVHAATPARESQLLQRVVGALELTRAAGAGFVVRLVDGRSAVGRLVGHRGPLFNWPCPLNAAELATVLGWPIGNPYLDGVAYRGQRRLPPAPGNWISDTTAQAAPTGRYRVLGCSTYPGRGGMVHLPAADALHHLHVVGPTGTGKSVLLARLIDADINAGRSVVVVEPKADLIAAVVDRIPERRVNDVVLVDPGDGEHAVGVDVLGSSDPELAADRVVHLLREMYRESWGPRTSQVLHAALLTLARSGQTLADLPHLLTNAGYRDRVLERAPDPLGTAPFWAWFGSLSTAEQNAVVGPSLHRLGAFTARRALRAAIGQPAPRFRMQHVFTGPGRRVLLINLAKGIVGPEAARLLGSLLLGALWQAAMARVAVAPERRHPVMVYVDEFQDYVSGIPLDFGDMLVQARGLGVAVTLAHQGLHQVDPTTRTGVLSNARSRVVFQDTGPDATRLATALGGNLTAADLGALGPFEGYTSLLHGHAVAPPASVVTLPPLPGLGATGKVRERSREQWGDSIENVEAAILARRQNRAVDAGLGGRRQRQRP